MKVGCVREIKSHEYRVGVTPDNVHEYVKSGHTFMIEAGAGEGAGFSDEEYRSAGATIVVASQDIWAECDMIIKVKEPLEAEYPLMREKQILYTYLHLAANFPLTEALLKAKVKGVAYETLRDNNGCLPLLKPMSEVAGRLSVQEGAKYLEKPFGGSGVLLGGVPGTKKAKVVILGGGTVGTNACKIAVGLGADVTILDKNLERLTYLDDSFGSRIQTLYCSDEVVRKEMITADLVIGSVLIPGASAPKLIKREYLAEMRPGSVIVDVAVDQGGCSEVTHPTYHDNPVFTVDGVVNYCVANMPGATPRTSTFALTNATLPYGLLIANCGLENAILKNPTIRSAVNTYQGECTCKEVAECHQLKYYQF